MIVSLQTLNRTPWARGVLRGRSMIFISLTVFGFFDV